MKGLLLKELYAVKKNCKLYITTQVLFLLCFLLPGREVAMCSSFSACVMWSSMLIASFAEDDKSGWSRYIGVLPYSKAQIVSARYIISTVVQAVFLLSMAVAQAVAMNFKGGFSLGEYLTYLSMLFLLSSAIYGLYPIRFRFGTRGLKMIAVVYGLIIANFFIITNIVIMAGIAITELKFAIVCIAAAAVYGLSWYLSVVFYKKREI